MIEFLFDPDDPTAVQEWTVPAGWSDVEIHVCGGGTWISSEFGVPASGWRLPVVTVVPGWELTVLLGACSLDTAGGYPDGGNGGGGGPGFLGIFPGARGFGGGGSTSVLVNGELWLVSGGAGGAVETLVAVGSSYDVPVGRPLGDPVPGPSEAPRVPLGDPGGGPLLDTVLWTPGTAGGEEAGAVGLTGGDPSYGSGGGGGGYGGGASGGIGLYEYLPPYEELEPVVSPVPGRYGGSLLPADRVPWAGEQAGDGIYSSPAAGGYLRLSPGSVRPTSQWSVGRLAL